MTKTKKKVTQAPVKGLVRQFRVRLRGLAQQHVPARPREVLRVVARHLLDRARLAQALVTGDHPHLKDAEDNWPVTKTQMLAAHGLLERDILALRDRIDRIMHRVEAPQAVGEDAKIKAVGGK